MIQIRNQSLLIFLTRMMRNKQQNKINFIFRMETATVNYNNKCRFCYSYTPPKQIDSCCIPKPCTNEDLLVVSSLQCVTNNSTRTSERSLLLQLQRQYLEENTSTLINNTLQSTLQNSSAITSTIYGQLLQIRQDRTLPYRTYSPPVIPLSVIQLQMATVNVGVPQSFFTIMDCKGSQSVTT